MGPTVAGVVEANRSILPGIAMHIIGDVVYAYFALLGGDWSVLFDAVNPVTSLRSGGESWYLPDRRFRR